ncbi:MAG TPA: precorrin-8X methylmutase [Streptosporangiaceae bacterium]
MSWRDGDHETDRSADGEALDPELQALRSRVDLTGLPGLTRTLTERVILASADPGYARDLVCSEPWLEAACGVLARGAPVVADTPMTTAGISGEAVICKAGQSLTERLARTAAISRAAAAVRLAHGEAGPGAVWVVGSEPLAIYEILSRNVQPALVIALPAGFIAAVEAKKVLRDSGLPALINVSEKGGPAVAAAACQALLAAAGVESGKSTVSPKVSI